MEFEDDALLVKLMFFIEKSANVLFIQNPKEDQWIKEDPKDNKFIACAIALNADQIVSGDSRLTRTKKVGNINTLTPMQFSTLMSGKG